MNPAPDDRPTHPPAIRLATPDDAAAIARVHVIAWQQTYAGILPAAFLDQLSVEEDTRRWRQLMESPERGIFIDVATTDPAGTIVGFAAGGPNRGHNRRYGGELQALYLLRSSHRRGIGTALLRAVAGELAERQMPSMIAWVLSKNRPARQFYRARGGRSAGRRRLEIAGVTLDAVGYGWMKTGALRSDGPS